MYYFGAYGGPGHYLWQRVDKTIRQVGRWELPSDFPVRIECLDSGFLPPALAQNQSACRVWRTNGWAVVAFWDRTGDPRRGSNSAFILRCDGFSKPDELIIGEVIVAFPEIMKRLEAVLPYRLILASNL